MTTFRARRRLTGLNKFVDQVQFALGWGILILVFAGLWIGLGWWEGWLDRERYADPYAFTQLAVGGRGPTTYERRLASGQTITIDNRHAMFCADARLDDPLSNRLFPTFAAAAATATSSTLPLLPSASLIHWRLTCENDLLLESIQRDVQSRLVPAVEGLAARASTEDLPTGLQGFFAAALSIAGRREIHANPPAIAAEAARQLAEFEAGIRSAGRMFNNSLVPARYAGSPEGAVLFRFQRFLMSPMPAEDAGSLAGLLAGTPDSLAEFDAIDRLQSIADNPAETASVLDLARSGGTVVARGSLPFLPTASSPENALYTQRHGTAPLGPGDNWMNEVVGSIRSGDLDLTPTAASGWYDRQLYALAPLVARRESAELSSNKLRAAPPYLQVLEETFRGAITADRETHVLRIEPVYMALHFDQQPELTLAPEFSCEPAPTLYWRLSLAYAWLAQSLPPGASVQEAQRLADLTRGLAGLSARELGLPFDFLAGDPALEEVSAGQMAGARDWLEALPQDPVLARDPRRVLSVASGHAWAILGVRLRRVEFSYETLPWVIGFGVKTVPVQYWSPVLVAAELPHTPLEADFLETCNRHDRVDRCLAALDAVGGESHDLIPLRLVLAWLTVFTALELTWSVWKRERAKRLRPGWHFPRFVGGLRALERRALRESTRWRLVRGVVVLLAIVGCLLSMPFLILNVLPRFDLPRWHVAQVSGAVAVQGLNLLQPGALDHMDEPPFWTHNALVDAAVAMALRSDNAAVRHNALNLWSVSSTLGRAAWDAIMEVAETRGADEANLALDWLPGASYNPWIVSTHMQSERYLPRLNAMLERHGNPPLMVAKVAPLWAKVDARDKLPVLNQAILGLATAEDRWELQSAIVSAFQLDGTTLPYDQLVALGIAPADPADLTPVRVPGRSIMQALERNLESLNLTEYRPAPDPPFTDELCRRSMVDSRVPIYLVRCQELSGRLHPFLGPAHYFSPVQRLEHIELLGEWLRQGPDGRRYGTLEDTIAYLAVVRSPEEQARVAEILEELAADPRWGTTKAPKREHGSPARDDPGNLGEVIVEARGQLLRSLEGEEE